MSKIIFLDIDGVLNGNDTDTFAPSGAIGVSDNKISLLKNIIDATGAKIVLSSTWRYDRPSGKDYQYLRNKLSEHGISIYDYTPDIHSPRRGMEISSWLAKHPEVDNWIVIDDIEFSDFGRNEFYGHLVITNPHCGLTEADIEKAIGIFNNEIL